MGKLLRTARTHLGLAAIGTAVLIGGGVATAAVVVTPAASTEDVYEAPATETEPAATTEVPVMEAPAPVVELAPEPPAPVVAPPVQEVPAAEPRSATVEPVSPQTDEPLPEGWTPPANPGEPARAPEAPLPLAPCLPGETGGGCASTE